MTPAAIRWTAGKRLIIGCRVWSDAMVDEQSGGGFERRPDVDAAALGALLRRVLGPGLWVARTPAGVAAQVYRVEAAGRVLYARIAEEAHEDLSVDAALLEHLRNRGLHVPAVVHVEPFDQALGRSLLILGEIPGAPLAHCRDQGAARRVARAAGAELAALNVVGVRGFGWVQRRPPPWPLRGSFRDYAGFVGSDLPDPWPGPLAALLPAAELDRRGSLVASERSRKRSGSGPGSSARRRLPPAPRARRRRRPSPPRHRTSPRRRRRGPAATRSGPEAPSSPPTAAAQAAW
jgi:hypothetical protein